MWQRDDGDDDLFSPDSYRHVKDVVMGHAGCSPEELVVHMKDGAVKRLSIMSEHIGQDMPFECNVYVRVQIKATHPSVVDILEGKREMVFEAGDADVTVTIKPKRIRVVYEDDEVPVERVKLQPSDEYSASKKYEDVITGEVEDYGERDGR